MNFSLRHQIVIPFMATTVLVGAMGTAVVMAQLRQSTTTQFDATLLRAGDLATDHLALLEADRVAQLRAAANTTGVPEALAGRQSQRLNQLLGPLVSNAQPPLDTMMVLDPTGAPVLVLTETAAGAVTQKAALPPGLEGQSEVRAVLAGVTDQQGDKYVFERSESGGVALYWAAPVHSGTSVAGAIVLREPLASVAKAIKGSGRRDVAFFSPSGELLTSTLNGVGSLAASDIQGVGDLHVARLSRSIGGHSYGLLVAPWLMRQRPLGYVGAAINADAVKASLGQLALILALVFALAAALVIGVGLALASWIIRPIQRLVPAMQAVAGGDLARRAVPAGRDEIGVLTSSFNSMAAALQHSRSEVEEAYFGSLDAFARAIDARDSYTFEHSARVAAISLEIADAMGVSGDDRKALRRSGLLHDIGKIGVQDEILLKPGPLTEEEWEQIRRHPGIGFDILKDIGFLKRSLEGVRHHHERWDGSGYPDGLKGVDIPPQARIISLADAFDAMTSDRAYRKGYSIDFAVATIRQGAGSQFDPETVRAFESRLEAILAQLRRMSKAPTPHSSDIHWREEEAA